MSSEPNPSPAPPRDTGALAAFLTDRDVPCPNPKCGFNLRGLKDATCPECQEPLSLTIRRPEALWRARQWLVATIVLVASASIERIAFLNNFENRWHGDSLGRWAELWTSACTLLVLAVALTKYAIASPGRKLSAIATLLLVLLVVVAMRGCSGLVADWLQYLDSSGVRR